MGILIVAAIATAVGFVLILLIGRNQPVSPASPDKERDRWKVPQAVKRTGLPAESC